MCPSSPVELYCDYTREKTVTNVMQGNSWFLDSTLFTRPYTLFNTSYPDVVPSAFFLWRRFFYSISTLEGFEGCSIMNTVIYVQVDRVGRRQQSPETLHLSSSMAGKQEHDNFFTSNRTTVFLLGYIKLVSKIMSNTKLHAELYT